MELGLTNTLKIRRFTPHGAFLGDGQGNEVLLPKKYLTDAMKQGEDIEVFLYKDSEDRPVATTETPLVKRNEFACLHVKDVNQAGAFLDWGLEKDLFVPFKEQTRKMKPGHWHLVYVYLDPKTDRLMASAKVYQHADKEPELKEGDPVEIIVGPTNEHGIQVIANGKHLGLLYENEVFENLLMGEKKQAFVKTVREDGKLDLSLRKTGMDQLQDGTSVIIEALSNNGGQLPIHDKSDPEEIQSLLHMSKKNFKRSLGILYKQGKVVIHEDHIEVK